MKLSIEGVIRAFGGVPVADINNWRKWWSTRLSMLSASLAAAATAYNALPDGWRTSMPDWIGTGLGGAAVVVAALIPLARGISQPGLMDGGSDAATD